MKILGIDPGPEESGICLIETGKPLEVKILRCDKVSTSCIFRELETLISEGNAQVAIEGMVYQGRGFGQSSIQTCYLIGRIQQFCNHSWGIPLTLYSRREYGQWIVAGGKLNDATLRAALESVYGKSAKRGDPLYALRGATDKRSAFAIAKYHEHKLLHPNLYPNLSGVP